MLLSALVMAAFTQSVQPEPPTDSLATYLEAREWDRAAGTATAPHATRMASETAAPGSVSIFRTGLGMYSAAPMVNPRWMSSFRL